MPSGGYSHQEDKALRVFGYKYRISFVRGHTKLKATLHKCAVEKYSENEVRVPHPVSIPHSLVKSDKLKLFFIGVMY